MLDKFKKAVGNLSKSDADRTEELLKMLDSYWRRDEKKAVDLIRAGVDLKRKKDGKSLLRLMIGENWRYARDALIAKGADLTERSDSGETLLMMSASKDDTTLFDLLLEKTAQLNEQDNRGRTALHHAAMGWSVNRRYYVEQLIARKKTELNLQDDERKTALHIALSHGNKTEAGLLIAAGADILLQDSYGRDALAAALHNEINDIAIELVEKGAPIKTSPVWESTFVMAARSGCKAITDKLLLDGVSREIKSAALLEASYRRRTDIARSILANGDVDIDCRNGDMVTPLMVAASGREDAITYALLAAGADVTLADNTGSTALHHAVRGGSAIVLQTILDRNPPLDVVNKAGELPIDLAITGGNVAMIEQLLEKGSPFDIEKSGAALLFMAAENGTPKLLSMLLAKGVSPDAVNSRGVSALMQAIFNGDEGAVRILLGKGANILLRDNEGRSALQFARNENMREIIRAEEADVIRRAREHKLAEFRQNSAVLQDDIKPLQRIKIKPQEKKVA